MDFSAFTTTRKYLRGDTEYELRFDFELRELTGHNRKTFDYCQSLIYFLQNNIEKKIFLTKSKIEDFYEEGNNLIINLPCYQGYCKKLSQNGKNKTQAFLAQKIKHYTEADKAGVISNASAEEINANINSETRQRFFDKLQATANPEVFDKNRVITVNNENKKQVIEQLLEKGLSEEFWELASSKNPELTERLAAGRLQVHRRKVVDELKQRLNTNSFSETAGNDSWQKWIYKHNWLFGINYQIPIEKQKISITGIMPDFLFPTLDGFVDILEIKLPSPEVIEKDMDHSGSWVWSKDANYAIGQVINYLCEIDRLRLEIEKQITQSYQRSISMLKPRAFILIGQNVNWDSDKKDGLRKLNHSLHGIEILTYSDLLKRGEAFIESTPNTYAE